MRTALWVQTPPCDGIDGDLSWYAVSVYQPPVDTLSNGGGGKQEGGSY